MSNDPRANHRAPLRIVLAAALGLAACSDPAPPPDVAAGAQGGSSPAEEPVRLAEAFLTPMDTIDNVDSPAVWRAPGGEILLLVTAKGSHVVMAYDGETGALVGRMGREGSAPGEFLRPNGIFVHDDLVYIVERDNRRVQVLTLPDFQPVATFGDNVLLKPYGITGFEGDDGILHLWITDDFDVTGEDPAIWENRVKRFSVEIRGTGVDTTVFDRESLQHLRTFAGEAVANTDGVAVLTGPAGRLGEGAFYAIHADQGAVGFAWSDVASALGLRPAC